MATAIKKFEGTIGASGSTTNVFDSALLSDTVYDSVSANFSKMSSWDSSVLPSSISWNNDGTRIYFNDRSGGNATLKNLYSIGLDTAWDLGSINAASFTSHGELPNEGFGGGSSDVDYYRGFDFSPDGTRLVIAGVDATAVEPKLYTLSTGFDISTASLTTWSQGAFGTALAGNLTDSYNAGAPFMKWINNGSTLAMLGANSTHWVMCTESSLNSTYGVPSGSTTANQTRLAPFDSNDRLYGFEWDESGHTYYIFQGYSTSANVYTFQTTTQWNPTNTTAPSGARQAVNNKSIPRYSTITYGNIPLNGMAVDRANNEITFFEKEYGFRKAAYLNAAPDLGLSALLSTDTITTNTASNYRNHYMKSDGTKYYAATYNTSGTPSGWVLIEYTLSTPFDFSTATETARVDASITTKRAWTFSDDGKYLYQVNWSSSTGTNMYRAELNTAWDLGSGFVANTSYSNLYSNVSTAVRYIGSISVNPTNNRIAFISNYYNYVVIADFNDAGNVEAGFTSVGSSTSLVINQDTNGNHTFSGKSLVWEDPQVRVYSGDAATSAGDFSIFTFADWANTACTTCTMSASSSNTNIDVSSFQTSNLMSVMYFSAAEISAANNSNSYYLISTLGMSDANNYFIRSNEDIIDLDGNEFTFKNSSEDGAVVYMTQPSTLKFGSNGSVLLMTSSTSTSVKPPTVAQFTLGTAYDMSTATPSGTHFLRTSSGATPINVNDLSFNGDGTQILYSSGSNIYAYDLSTPYDISSAGEVYDENTTLSGMSTSFVFNNDGTKIIASSTNTVFQFNLSTAYDINTAVAVDSKDINPDIGGNYIENIRFNSTGTRMYVVDDTLDRVHLFGLYLPYEVSSVFYTGNYFGTGGQTSGDLKGIDFKDDGTKMFAVDRDSGAEVYQYSTTSSVGTNVTAYTCPANTAAKVMISVQGEFGDIKVDTSTIVKIVNKAGIYHTGDAHKSTANDAVIFLPNGVNGVIANEYKQYFQLAAAEVLSIQNARNMDYSIYVIEDNA